ncbi:MAG TPA: adenylate/guanylate cyclase domain-containing protein [Thermoanaerobaculia bacterium]|nr:adenylate/guanylate cyclase domain-containing protein [Thermoanaerobaculia bacterium]
MALTSGRAFLVGRAMACDLLISDPTVSRQHAELESSSAGVVVHDLQSTNGTYVNGQRVAREALAPPGSHISFGKVDFAVHESEAIVAAEDSGDDSSQDATILRQVPVRGGADIASRLAAVPQGSSLLKIAGESAAERQTRKLDLLLDIAKELSQQVEIDRLLEKVVDVTFQVMSVDRVAILLGGEEGELAPRISRSHAPGPAGEWHVPHAIARKTVAERVAVLIENVPADLRFSEGTVLRHRVQSALCAPLLGSQEPVLGLIYLDNLGATHSFTAEDLDFLTAFASMISVAIQNSHLVEKARREAVVLSNFQRYFAPDLARQIGGEEGAIQLGGAKRRVVVLFSDIRGFTALSESMSPDDIAHLLTDYFTEMVEIVFEHGGTLDKFMGDALMSLWGAPLAHKNDADRAIHAAVAMQRALERLNDGWRQDGRPTLEVGIGINVGEVFAGNIGSERRLEYTVIGDAVNIASRLCAEASPREILISDELFLDLTTPPPVTALQPLPLKGKTQAVQIYRVDWRRSPSDTWPKTPAASDTIDVSSVAETLARVQQHLAGKGEERG